MTLTWIQPWLAFVVAVFFLFRHVQVVVGSARALRLIR